MSIGDGTTLSGNISSLRSSYQTLTSNDAFSKAVQWAAFNKSPFLQACGIEAFGVDAVQDLQKFGNARATGRMVRYDSGVYGIRGSIFATTPTSFHVGRMGSWNAQLVEGGDEYAWSWYHLAQSEYIPVGDVQDNTKGNIDIKVQKMQGMKQTFARDLNYCILGNSSAPDTGVLDPAANYGDLPNIISYTQTRTVGGIAKSIGTYWQNQYKSCATIGGGGEMDRPLALRWSIMDGLNDALSNAEASNDYLMLGTQGAWQYYDRLMYADGKGSGAFLTKDSYDAAGVPNFAINGNPFIWDPAVTIPYNSTASTECIYGIHIPSFAIAIRSEENFKFSGWEEPRVHDQYKTINATLSLRYCPMVTAMRPHVVFYNMPACPD